MVVGQNVVAQNVVGQTITFFRTVALAVSWLNNAATQDVARHSSLAEQILRSVSSPDPSVGTMTLLDAREEVDAKNKRLRDTFYKLQQVVKKVEDDNNNKSKRKWKVWRVNIMNEGLIAGLPKWESDPEDPPNLHKWVSGVQSGVSG